MVRLVYLPTCKRSSRLLANELLLATVCACMCVRDTGSARSGRCPNPFYNYINLINFTRFCGVVYYSDFIHVIMPSFRRSVRPNRTFIQNADVKYIESSLNEPHVRSRIIRQSFTADVAMLNLGASTPGGQFRSDKVV